MIRARPREPDDEDQPRDSGERQPDLSYTGRERYWQSVRDLARRLNVSIPEARRRWRDEHGHPQRRAPPPAPPKPTITVRASSSRSVGMAHRSHGG